MYKKSLLGLLSLVVCLSLFVFGSADFSAKVNAAPAFAKGADISWVPGMEAQGYVWRDKNGVQRDILQILKDDYQINSVRIRVFVNPSGDYGNGYMDMNRAATLAQRAKNLGMRVMLTLHYSDSWADPGKQTKPAAWSGYSFQQLMDVVYSYTRDVLFAMQNKGVTPEWVQIGNETNNGMLWDDGKASVNMQNYAWLVNTGHNAVKSVNSGIKTVVHLANGYDNGLFQWNIGGLVSNGANFDVIAMSLYPSSSNWTTLNSQALSNMQNMISSYGKEIMVSEVGMDYGHPAEAKSFVADIVSKTQSLSGGKGLGVFYWEPEAYPNYNGGYTNGAWNSNGMPTGALDGFVQGGGSSGGSGGIDPNTYYKIVNRNSGKVLDVDSSSTANGAQIIQWTYSGGWNQQWKFVDAGGGYYKIQNRNSGKLMDIEAHSTADGAHNIQWSDNGGTNQQWKLINAGSGYYKIQNRNSGKILDISGASTANGAIDIQWPDNGGYNQQWQIVAAN